MKRSRKMGLLMPLLLITIFLFSAYQSSAYTIYIKTYKLEITAVDYHDTCLIDGAYLPDNYRVVFRITEYTSSSYSSYDKNGPDQVGESKTIQGDDISFFYVKLFHGTNKVDQKYVPFGSSSSGSTTFNLDDGSAITITFRQTIYWEEHTIGGVGCTIGPCLTPW